MDLQENQSSYGKRLWLLFYTFAKIAALVVGGGYAILPVVEETFSRKNKLISSEELLDMMALVQTIPGIIAANSAIYVGMKVAGIGGVLAAVFGVCLPSVTVIIIIAAFFPHLKPENPYLLGAFVGVRACITGLIIVTAARLAKKTIQGWFEIICVSAFLILALFKLNPICIIALSMPLGILYTLFCTYRIKRNEVLK